MNIRAFAAFTAAAPLLPFEFEAGDLPPDHLEVKVEHCGLCHSDLSMIDNAWGMSTYPLIPGHEVIGRVVAAGPQVRRAKVGDRVGIGWLRSSCMACAQCLSGEHHLCDSITELTVGHHGGFAERVRAHWVWATPLPEGITAHNAGPLLCGGATVFQPIERFGVKPTDRVGVVGIGGLGHLALQLLRAWGCEVTAFTSSPDKAGEALTLGAHRAISSTDERALARERGRFDFLLVTANVTLPWGAYLAALTHNGRLHFVGSVPEPLSLPLDDLCSGQNSISGSLVSSPGAVARMLEFCARHAIEPEVERFPMSRIQEAIEHLRKGRARYRVVLDADFD